MSRAYTAPAAPWYDQDDPEYVDDEVLYSQVVQDVRDHLKAELVQRIQALEDGTFSDVLEEIRRQMTLKASEARFGEARDLHDMALSLLLAQDKAKRAV